MYNDHSQKDRKLAFKTNYHLIQVKSISECPTSIDACCTTPSSEASNFVTDYLDWYPLPFLPFYECFGMYEALFGKIITGWIISETDLTKEKPGELFVF